MHYSAVTAVVANNFSHGQNFHVVMERSQDLGENLLNRTCYATWARHVDRLGMKPDSTCISTYRNFMMTGCPASSERPGRSRDRFGNIDRSQSRGRSSRRGSSRGRSTSRTDFRNSQPGPSRRRSPDRSDSENRRPSKRGRSSGRDW